MSKYGSFGANVSRRLSRIKSEERKKKAELRQRDTLQEENIDTRAYAMASKQRQKDMREVVNNRKLSEFGGV